MRVKCRVSPDMHLLSQTEYYYCQYRKNNQAHYCKRYHRATVSKDFALKVVLKKTTHNNVNDIDVEILVLN